MYGTVHRFSMNWNDWNESVPFRKFSLSSDELYGMGSSFDDTIVAYMVPSVST